MNAKIGVRGEGVSGGIVEGYARLLQSGKAKDDYARKVTVTRTRRGNKRKMSGDDPTDWLPRAGKRVVSEEEASTSGIIGEKVG